MKLLLSFIVLSICSITQLLADHPYFPISKKHTIKLAFTSDEMTEQIGIAYQAHTGEMEEKNGKKYYVATNYSSKTGEGGEKKSEHKSWVRIDKDGNLFAITALGDKEAMVLPNEKNLKKGFSWDTDIAGFKLSYSIATLNGSISHGAVKLDNLLVVNSIVNEETSMNIYYQKGLGPVGIGMVTKGEGEQLTSIIAQ